MLIGIDAHNLEGNRTGVGRYLFNLLKEWTKKSSGCHSEAEGRRISHECGSRIRERSFASLRMTDNLVKFILYFKNEIPLDIPESELFENKLLNVGSTAKFVHWDLARAATRDKIDILFCPGYIAPIFYKDKIALTLHDIIYEVHPELFEWKSPADKVLLKWVSRASAQKAKIIFTISEFSRKEIIEHYRVPPEKVILTYLAAEISDESIKAIASIDSTKGIEAFKNRYFINDKFAFFVGSIFSRRHLPEIIEAFSRIAKERSDWQLLLAGRDYTRGKSVDKLAQKVNAQLRRPAVLRVDFVADFELKLLYSACAFFIWLSDYEGFGLPVLEAMAGGAPVLTSDGSSLKEVAGEAALLIKDNSDVEEIYRAMEKMIEDESLRSQLIAKGRAQAAKFSWKECAEETLKTLINT